MVGKAITTILLTSTLSIVTGFRLYDSCILSRSIRTQLFAENEPSTPSSSTNTEDFAKKEMMVIDKDDEIVVDLDALAAESAFQAFKPKTDLTDMFVKQERKAPREAEWFPFLLSPPALDGTFAGDVGFDPLGFAKDKATLVRMRDAEIKHSRLAMLAAAGWPLSELWHKEIASTFRLESILAAADKAPSVLNGGLSNYWIIGTGIASLLIGAVLELGTMEASQKVDYIPGDLGFDPLRLHTIRSSFKLDRITEKITPEEKIRRAKKDMELCEIKHGRLAMLAITAFAMQEFVSGVPVVQQTPFFFGDPII